MIRVTTSSWPSRPAATPTRRRSASSRPARVSSRAACRSFSRPTTTTCCSRRRTRIRRSRARSRTRCAWAAWPSASRSIPARSTGWRCTRRSATWRSRRRPTGSPSSSSRAAPPTRTRRSSTRCAPFATAAASARSSGATRSSGRSPRRSSSCRRSWASTRGPRSSVILAGDAGGTKTLLALFEPGDGAPVLVGEAIVVIDGGRRTVFATEGGHADFGPRGELEEDLLRYLRKEFGRVSYERVLSGPGLVNVYRFLRDTGVAGESSPTAERMAAGDPAAVITELGLDGADRLCALALALFVSVAEAGNLALKALAVGGVIVAGGIAPRILPALRAGSFVAAFRDKGRLSSLMETIPVFVALNPKTALLGAARVAACL